MKTHKQANKSIMWDFAALNPEEFTLTIMIPGIKNKMMKVVFDNVKSKLLLLKRKDAAVVPSFDDISDFSIPEEHIGKFKQLLLTSVQQTLKDVRASIGKDGVHIVTSDLKRCSFAKKGGVWEVNMVIYGDYVIKVKK